MKPIDQHCITKICENFESFSSTVFSGSILQPHKQKHSFSACKINHFVRFLFSCFCFLFSIFATKPLKDSNHDQVELGEQKANNLCQNRSEPLQRWTSIFVTSSSHLLKNLKLQFLIKL
ncbi:hypothetical protein BpHYR1_042907 [Brachionus plicatilis]|uniref:Uncharacterized protein n=1 Tax=Brachionus plicatilis TaxID=10195 RepID=A0A3M7T4P2_BRAPC|nr:hypothetical protein BpHYR1_042907 [Brachionus plicatilis]